MKKIIFLTAALLSIITNFSQAISLCSGDIGRENTSPEMASKCAGVNDECFDFYSSIASLAWGKVYALRDSAEICQNQKNKILNSGCVRWMATKFRIDYAVSECANVSNYCFYKFRAASGSAESAVKACQDKH